MKLDNQQPSTVDWIAGFFDGDGSICYTGSSDNGGRISCSFTNTHDATILTLFNFFKDLGIEGNIVIDERFKNHKPCYSLRFTNRETVLKFLNFILPNLRRRQQQANLARCFLYSRIQNNSFRLTDEELELIKEIKKLNNCEGSETIDLPLSVNWLAGYIDANGCFSFATYKRNGSKLSITPVSVLTVPSKPTAEYCTQIFKSLDIPVWFETLDKRSEGKKIIYRLNTKGLERIIKMKVFSNSLFIKNNALNLLLDFSTSRLSKSRQDSFSSEELSLVQQLKQINKTGR
mgnify:CR=1 FL=1